MKLAVHHLIVNNLIHSPVYLKNVLTGYHVLTIYGYTKIK